jgi:hypothetical protein
MSWWAERRHKTEHAPVAVDRVEEASRLRRAAQAELDRAAAAKLAFKREYQILTKVWRGKDTSVLLSCRVPRGKTRRWIDGEWLRLCQHEGRALHEFSARLHDESEAKEAR